MMTIIDTIHIKYIFEDSHLLHYIINGHFKRRCNTHNFKSETIYAY